MTIDLENLNDILNQLIEECEYCRLNYDFTDCSRNLVQTINFYIYLEYKTSNLDQFILAVYTKELFNFHNYTTDLNSSNKKQIIEYIISFYK
jgi:hypothetical protein